MKKILLSACFALITFGFSAAGSWYWQQKLHAGSSTNGMDDVAEESTESTEEESHAPAAQNPPTAVPNRQPTTDLRHPRQALDQSESRTSKQPSIAAGV